MDAENIPSNVGGFKKFVKSAHRIIDKISVTSGGSVGFSTSFSNEHKLNFYKGAILYWNTSTNEIGIEFVTEENDETMRLVANKNGYGHTINAKAFFAVNHIDTKKHHGRFDYRVVPFNQIDPLITNGGNMYTFSIREAKSVVATTPPPQLPSQITAPVAPEDTAPGVFNH